MKKNIFVASICVALLEVVSFSVGCADPAYIGDGKATFLNGPPLGIDGYEIEFPEMTVSAGSAHEFSVSQFPRKGLYTIYLTLSDDTVLDRCAYTIEVFRNGKQEQMVDTRKLQTRKTYCHNRQYCQYLFSMGPEDTGDLDVRALTDQWKIRITFVDVPANIVPPLTGHLLLQMGGSK